MSTISDALKKAQETRIAGAGRPWPSDSGTLPPPLAGKTNAPRDGGKTKAALAAILIAGLVFAAGFLLVFHPGILPSRNGPTVKPLPALPAPGVAPTRPPAEFAPPPAAGPVVALSSSKTEASAVAKADGAALPPAAAQDAQAAARVEPSPVPAARNSPPADAPQLSGIFYSEQNPIAILNGASLKEGEKAGSWQVVKIRLESVTVRSGGGEDVEIRMK